MDDLTWDNYANDLAIPDGWENVSYGNDACPSFAFEGYQIFHDHPNPEEREEPEWERFRVIIESQYGHGDCWDLATDDFNAVLEAIKTPFGKRMKFEVTWGHGYKTDEPRIITVDDLINSDEWDIDLMNTVVSSGDFIHNLGDLQIGKIYEYIDYSGTIYFKKLPQSALEGEE